MSSLGMSGGDAGRLEILRVVQAGADGYGNTLPSWCVEQEIQ